jgi:hypothetical protein
MTCVKTPSELFAVERSTQQMSLERVVLPDRSKVLQKHLGARWVAKPAQVPLMFMRRLMAILGPIIEMAGTARFAPGSLDGMREPPSKFVAPAANGFVTHRGATVQEQLFNVAQAQLKPEIPANGATDHHRWKAMAMIERFCLFYLSTLRDHICNVTKPSTHLTRSDRERDVVVR